MMWQKRNDSRDNAKHKVKQFFVNPKNLSPRSPTDFNGESVISETDKDRQMRLPVSDAKFGAHATEDPFLERICQICGYMVPLTLYDDH